MERLTDNFDLIYTPKIEPESDYDSKDSPSSSPASKPSKINWSNEDTLKLIDQLATECQELWDMKHPGYKDRGVKADKQAFLANMFGTTSEEIVRKLHNMRTQFNSELRKIKRRRLKNKGEPLLPPLCRWEYFEPLSFLLPASIDDTDTTDIGMDTADTSSIGSANLELAQFQRDYEASFGVEDVEAEKANETQATPPKEPQTNLSRFLSSLASLIENAPPPSPEPFTSKRSRPSQHTKDSQIFGDFVASELRALRTDHARVQLKRMIQMAILQVGKEEDTVLNQTPPYKIPRSRDNQ